MARSLTISIWNTNEFVVTMDEQVSDYMIWKLNDGHKLCRLDIHFRKTEQLVIGLDGNDMVTELQRVQISLCTHFKRRN